MLNQPPRKGAQPRAVIRSGVFQERNAGHLLEIAAMDIAGFSTAKPTDFVRGLQLVSPNGRTLRI
jgi:hypothetical protein